MDLMTVAEGTYLPEKLVEGYSSLIWTERYRDPGEFELKTPLILETMRLLPEKSFVTHRETDQVMMVETHSIAKNQLGFKELTVKGRTLDSFLQHRVLEGRVAGKKYRLNLMFNHPEMASLLVWNAVVNPTTRDILLQPTRQNTRDQKDTIPGVRVTMSTTNSYPKKRRWLKGGSVYPQLLQVLRAGRLGIRTIRPPSNAGRVVGWDEETESGIVFTQNPNMQNLRFDIYHGVDRRRQQTANDQVIFHYADDSLEDESYLFSSGGYNSMAMIVPGRYDPRLYYRDRPNDAELSSWDRRVAWIDGGEPDLEDIPEQPDDDATAAQKQAWREKRDKIKAENAKTTAEFREDLRDLADAEFEKSDRIKAFECKITSASPYKYKEHYDLGDKVTLIGEFDFDQTMQVVEHVRSDDGKHDDGGYPGLIAVD